MKFIFPFATIFLGLASGWVFSRLSERGTVQVSAVRAERIRLFLQRLALLGINPVAFCGAVWSLDLSNPHTFALPFVGLFALAAGGTFGLVGSRLLRLGPDRAGVYTTCSSFTNIGNIGGLVVFLLVGEATFALLPFYKLFEEFWYYSVLFPLARHYGAKAHPEAAAVSVGSLEGLIRVLRDPFFLVAIAGVSIGIGLNVSGIQRPAFYGRLNSFLVPSSSFILLFTIGMRIRFRIGMEDLKAAACILTSKIVLVPALAVSLATVLGLGQIEGGLKVVLVLAAMPIGFLGLVPPALFGLDEKFANSLWLVSNGALVLIIPALSIALAAIS